MEWLWIGLIVLAIVVILVVIWIIQKNQILFKNHQTCEVENYLQSQKFRLKEMELELRQEYEKKIQDFEKEKDKFQQQISKRLEEIAIKEEEISKSCEELERKISFQERLFKQCEELKKELKTTLSEYLDIPFERAKQELYALIEEDLQDYKGKLIRRYENEAKEEAKKRANYVIAQATTRYAGEFAQERLINIVNLPNDELKGRIIGKDGRNIKAIEMITGVDVIIDETPSTIVLSSFNLYRRAIATKMLEELIADGRIHPARIEEVYERVKEEMEEQILQDGEEVVLDLGLGHMHPDIKRLIGKLKYRASFGQNALGHSLEVARLAGKIAAELGGDAKLAKRAGILHDIGKSLTQDLGGNHVDLGYEIALKYQEDPIVLNAIKAHHGDEEVKSIEAAAVCAADTLSAARPGARREALESFLQRSVEIENLILQKIGVKQAYVINSGKEIRVIVDAQIADDNHSAVLAREIARQIEEGFQYPGEIKISVIRESRAVEIAR